MSTPHNPVPPRPVMRHVTKVIVGPTSNRWRLVLDDGSELGGWFNVSVHTDLNPGVFNAAAVTTLRLDLRAHGIVFESSTGAALSPVPGAVLEREEGAA